MKHEAFIQPSTLRAARQRAGLDREELARRLGVVGGESRVARWEEGSARPSFAQAREIARLLHVPFASLFLPPAALGSVDVPDLRTIGARRGFSVDLLDMYRDAQRKVAWVRDVRQQQGLAPIPFVGAGRLARDADVVRAGAAAIVGFLAVTPADRHSAGDPEDYTRLLVGRAEAAGVLVLRSSTVGTNTHRGLDVEEFRGFAISDELAPLVFVNTADAKTAQVFTLIHELAHIWRAETGVSQPALAPSEQSVRDGEAICDAIAAEVLVPESALRPAWQKGESLASNADRLRAQFKVSRMVLARRALDLGLVGRDEFDPYFSELMRIARAQPKAKGGAPPAATMVKVRNGATVTDMVTRAVRSGEMLWRDASRLLGVGVPTLARLVDQQEAQPG